MNEPCIIDATVIAEIATLVPNEPQFICDLIATFLRHAEPLLDQLQSETEDVAARSLAHKFKGMSLQVGACRLAHLCARIEDSPTSRHSLSRELYTIANDTFTTLKSMSESYRK